MPSTETPESLRALAEKCDASFVETRDQVHLDEAFLLRARAYELELLPEQPAAATAEQEYEWPDFIGSGGNSPSEPTGKPTKGPVPIGRGHPDYMPKIEKENARLSEELRSLHQWATQPRLWADNYRALKAENARLKEELAEKTESIQKAADAIDHWRNRARRENEIALNHEEARNALTTRCAELLAALENFAKVIGDRHYGRMPSDVEVTYEVARAAIANARKEKP